MFFTYTREQSILKMSFSEFIIVSFFYILSLLSLQAVSHTPSFRFVSNSFLTPSNFLQLHLLSSSLLFHSPFFLALPFLPHLVSYSCIFYCPLFLYFPFLFLSCLTLLTPSYPIQFPTVASSIVLSFFSFIHFSFLALPFLPLLT